MLIAITGASGFIGRRTFEICEQAGHDVLAISRQLASNVSESVSDLAAQLSSAQVVIHLAGRAHRLQDTADDPLVAFSRANRDLAVQVAEASVQAGVRRMVFVSSIAVHGPSAGRRLSPTSPCGPDSPYGLSKLEAEKALTSKRQRGDLELVIVRPPMVFGPRAPGNFGRLMQAVARGMPLPLASVTNRRSTVGVTNLASFLEYCSREPMVDGRTIPITDGPPLSTPEIIRRLAGCLGVKARLFAFPPGLLRFAGRLAGRERLVDQVCGSLEIDAVEALNGLGWTPMISVDEEFRRVGEAYREDARRQADRSLRGDVDV